METRINYFLRIIHFCATCVRINPLHVWYHGKFLFENDKENDYKIEVVCLSLFLTSVYIFFLSYNIHSNF